MMSEGISSDRDVDLAALVHHAVSTSTEYVKDFDKMLASSSENFTLPREVIQSLRALLWADSALVSNLFEENQQLLELFKGNRRMAELMKKISS
jgi:hypothetical protein